jgi:hypothetical protein
MFRKWLDKLLLAKIEEEKTDFNAYLSAIESGYFKDKVCYGIAEDRRGYLTADPTIQPGALYIGGMGSGKSIAARFTMLTRLFSNSEQDIYILVDALKGMTDYACVFPLKENVATALNDPAKIIPVIDMLHSEMMERKNAFSKVNAPNIYAYEKIIQQKDPNYRLARIFLFVEEFHAIPNSEQIKFSYKVDTPGTTAYKLKEITATGRSYGITLTAMSQRATPDDFPSTLKRGITQLMAFRVNNPGDAAAANLPQAADIRMEQRGRCVYEGGLIQFPWLPDDTAEMLIKRFYKPLKAKLFKYQMKDYHNALAGEGNDGMVWVKPLKDILNNINEFNPLEVYTRFLSSFDFTVSRQTNNALSVSLIAERDGKKYAVLCISGRGQTSEKSLQAFKEGASILGCEGVIAISSDSISSSVSSAFKEFQNKYIADGEDLGRIADVLDNKTRLEEIGYFEKLHSKLVFVKKLDKVTDDLNSEDEDSDDFDAEFEELRKKIML